jgi:tetratricopeptide (TPR) repeat protein
MSNEKDVGPPPSHDLLRRNYATALSRKNRHQEAISLMEETISFSPFRAANHEILAEVAERGGDFTKALEHKMLSRIMEPSRGDSLEPIGELVKKIAPQAEPFTLDSQGVQRLNLNDAVIEGAVRKAFGAYARILSNSGRSFEADRLPRIAKYNYGLEWNEN